MLFQASKSSGKVASALKPQIVALEETGDDQPDSDASPNRLLAKKKAKTVRNTASIVKAITVDKTKKPQPSTSKKGKKNPVETPQLDICTSK